jgi:hypothetical protein
MVPAKEAPCADQKRRIALGGFATHIKVQSRFAPYPKA